MLTFKNFLSLNEELVHSPGTQYGSNPGGVHTDSETGKKYYVKFYNNPEQAKSEALAGKIYNHMGIGTVNPEYRDMPNHPLGRHAVVTEWNENLSQMRPRDFENLNSEQQNQVGKMYHGAVLTKNWDIAGLVHDNIVQNKANQDLHSVDQGGVFEFRARGGAKPYGPDIGEHQSLRGNGEASGHIFDTVFKQNPRAELEGAKAVKGMNDEHVKNLFATSGLSNSDQLYSNFMARKGKLLQHYGMDD
jgi:hypothetical protein